MLYMILIGLLAGALAKFLMPGKDPGGMIITILLGIAGSVVGGYVGRMVGIVGNGLLGELLVATGGAVLLLFLYRMIKK
ncbi:MAG: GlsB/YeaQ/YmgE family stress response membrane protein [Bacteroidota bacterium]